MCVCVCNQARHVRNCFFTHQNHILLERLRTWIIQQQEENAFNGVESGQMVIVSEPRSAGCADLKL